MVSTGHTLPSGPCSSEWPVLPLGAMITSEPGLWRRAMSGSLVVLQPGSGQISLFLMQLGSGMMSMAHVTMGVSWEPYVLQPEDRPELALALTDPEKVGPALCRTLQQESWPHPP